MRIRRLPSKPSSLFFPLSFAKLQVAYTCIKRTPDIDRQVSNFTLRIKKHWVQLGCRLSQQLFNPHHNSFTIPPLLLADTLPVLAYEVKIWCLVLIMPLKVISLASWTSCSQTIEAWTQLTREHEYNRTISTN